MKVAVCIEQYDLVGILPSQLESLSLLINAMGVTKAAYIDGTSDGFSGVGGFTRYGNYADFFAEESGPFIVFSPDSGEDIRTLKPASDAWLVFGPLMGWGDILNGINIIEAMVPGGTMNSRDVVPIVLWETSSWQAQ